MVSNCLDCGCIFFVGIVAIMTHMRMGRHSVPIFNEGESLPPPRKRSKVGPPEIHAERNVVLRNPLRFKEDLKALREFIATHSLTDLAT